MLRSELWTCNPTVVVNESQFPEAVHERTNARSSGSDHFGQGLLAHPWKYGLRSPFLAKASQHKKYAGQPLRLVRLRGKFFGGLLTHGANEHSGR